MDTDYVTKRKRQLSNSLQNISNSNSSLFDATMMSLPNTSLNVSQTVIDLNETVRKLTLELQSAHKEIENLNSENSQLKTDVEKYHKVIETYKKIKLSGTPLTIHKKRKSQLDSISTPIKCNTPMFSLNSPTTINQLGSSCLKNTTSKKSVYITSTEQDNSFKANKPIIPDKNSATKPIQKEAYQKNVIVLADHQGWKIRELLQKLIGSEYKVSSFWKSGARMEEVLKSQKETISNLTMCDYVIIIGGSNDCNPYEFKLSIENWSKTVRNTNIIVSEIPYNRYLSEKKLNYELRFICSAHKNMSYVDMNYSFALPRGIYFAINLSRFLLRQILNIDNTRKYFEYQQHLCTLQKMQYNKYTQTETVQECVAEDIPLPITSPLTDEFFRV